MMSQVKRSSMKELETMLIISKAEPSYTHHRQLLLVRLVSLGVVYWMVTACVINYATNAPHLGIGTNTAKRILSAKDLKKIYQNQII